MTVCVTQEDPCAPAEALAVCRLEPHYESIGVDGDGHWQPICAPCLAVARQIGAALEARSA